MCQSIVVVFSYENEIFYFKFFCSSTNNLNYMKKNQMHHLWGFPILMSRQSMLLSSQYDVFFTRRIDDCKLYLILYNYHKIEWEMLSRGLVCTRKWVHNQHPLLYSYILLGILFGGESISLPLVFFYFFLTLVQCLAIL